MINNILIYRSPLMSMVADYVEVTAAQQTAGQPQQHVTAIADAITAKDVEDEKEPPRNETAEQLSLFPDNPDDSEPADNLSDSGMATPSEIISQGTSFLSNLVQTLSNPEKTKQLLDTLVHEDNATGQTTIRIPVSDRKTVQNFFSLVGQLLNNSKSQD